MTKDLLTWKAISESVLAAVNGNGDCDYEAVERTVNSKKFGIDQVLPLAKKIMNLNILDRKVNFEVFENLPTLWKMILGTAADVVAIDCGQAVMAR